MRKLLILFVVIVSACSTNKMQNRKSISTMCIKRVVSLGFTPDRVCIDDIYKTDYILERNQNRIHIYRDGIFVNFIGGIGSSKTRFQRLSDITLATDGGVFALDSATKLVKKYDRDGRFVSEWKLESFKRPERFVADNENNFYIFDFFGSTISLYNALSNTVDFDFGRFTFSNISSLDLVDSQLLIRDKQTEKTYVYNTIGKRIGSLTGEFTFDKYGNHIKMMPNWLETDNLEEKYCLSVDKYLSLRTTNKIVYCSQTNGFIVVEIHYSDNYER